MVKQGNVQGEKLIEALTLRLLSCLNKHIYVSFYRPRSQVFNEVAEVLEMVDSKGAGEIGRLRCCENVNLKHFEMRL